MLPYHENDSNMAALGLEACASRLACVAGILQCWAHTRSADNPWPCLTDVDRTDPRRGFGKTVISYVRPGNELDRGVSRYQGRGRAWWVALLLRRPGMYLQNICCMAIRCVGPFWCLPHSVRCLEPTLTLECDFPRRVRIDAHVVRTPRVVMDQVDVTGHGDEQVMKGTRFVKR